MKAKVTAVTLLTDRNGQPDAFLYEGKTYYSHQVTFDNNVSGVYTHLEQEQDYFKVGEEAEYETEEKKGVLRVRKPRRPGGGGGRTWKPKTPAELKREAVVKAAEFAKDIVVAGKAEKKEIPGLIASFMNAIKKEIDQCGG